MLSCKPKMCLTYVWMCGDQWLVCAFVCLFPVLWIETHQCFVFPLFLSFSPLLSRCQIASVSIFLTFKWERNNAKAETPISNTSRRAFSPDHLELCCLLSLSSFLWFCTSQLFQMQNQLLVLFFLNRVLVFLRTSLFVCLSHTRSTMLLLQTRERERERTCTSTPGLRGQFCLSHVVQLPTHSTVAVAYCFIRLKVWINVMSPARESDLTPQTLPTLLCYKFVHLSSGTHQLKLINRNERKNGNWNCWDNLMGFMEINSAWKCFHCKTQCWIFRRKTTYKKPSSHVYSVQSSLYFPSVSWLCYKWI